MKKELAAFFAAEPVPVTNTRTGAVVALFLLSSDARRYIKQREAQEGPNGCIYRIDINVLTTRR